MISKGGEEEGDEALTLNTLVITDSGEKTTGETKVIQGENRCQDHSSEDALYRITELPGKGEGMVAVRDIRPGSVILIESHLVVINGTLTDMQRIGAILQGFGDLSQQDQ